MAVCTCEVSYVAHLLPFLSSWSPSPSPSPRPLGRPLPGALGYRLWKLREGRRGLQVTPSQPGPCSRPRRGPGGAGARPEPCCGPASGRPAPPSLPPGARALAGEKGASSRGGPPSPQDKPCLDKTSCDETISGPLTAAGPRVRGGLMLSCRGGCSEGLRPPGTRAQEADAWSPLSPARTVGATAGGTVPGGVQDRAAKQGCQKGGRESCLEGRRERGMSPMETAPKGGRRPSDRHFTLLPY